MNSGALIEDLARRIEDEIAALDAGDHEALALATSAKLAALDAVRQASPEPLPSRALLARVVELNRAAASRVNRARARIERRLGMLSRVAGNQPPCAYGADGRPVTRFFRDKLSTFIPKQSSDRRHPGLDPGLTFSAEPETKQKVEAGLDSQ